MSSGLFQKAEVGIIPGVTWGTAVQLTGDILCKMTSLPNLNPQREVLVDEAAGMIFAEYADLGRKNVEISFGGDMRYDGSHLFHLCQLLGDDSVAGASAPYTHSIMMDDYPTYFYTMAALVDDQIYEWPSIKPTGFELSTGADGFMKYACTGIADRILIAGDATNVAGDITGATYTSQQLKMPFGHCRVNINAQGGADFNDSGNGSDRVYPSAITLSINRPYERDFVADRTTSNSREWETLEPVVNGMQSDIILTLEFPELITDDYLEAFQDNTMKKGELYIYHSSSNIFSFQFPNLYPLQPEVKPEGGGRIPHVVSYRAMKAQSAPTGMTGITNPIKLTIESSTSTSYHANS